MIYDFARELPGLDYSLGELIARREYGLILELIEMLPTASVLREKMEDDEEYVEKVREALVKNAGKLGLLKKAEKDAASAAEKGPRLGEWSITNQQLADLLYQLRINGAEYLSTQGNKPPQPKPPAVPKTLMAQRQEDVRMARKKMIHEHIIGGLVPKQPD